MFAWAAAALLVVALAVRPDTESTMIEVRHSSGMVKTKRNTSVHNHNERIHQKDASASASWPASEAAFGPAAALDSQPKAAGHSKHSAEDWRHADVESLEVDVAHRGHQDTAPSEAGEPELVDVVEEVVGMPVQPESSKHKIGAVVTEAPPPQVPSVDMEAEANKLSGDVSTAATKPTMEGEDAEEQSVQDDVPEALVSASATTPTSEGVESEKLELFQDDVPEEVALSTSTHAPDSSPGSQVFEEIKKSGFSLLSVVFFTYMLLSLAALAAFTAYMTRFHQDASSEETTEKEKWRNILRYGFSPPPPPMRPER